MIENIYAGKYFKLTEAEQGKFESYFQKVIYQFA